jgi:ABC-type multidrug transport system fused ATPase/permease subunit
MGLVVLMHVVINLCNLAVSLYLAFTLTERFVATGEDADHDRKYNIQLSLIIVGALASSFIGKYVSNYIFMQINHSVHREMVRSVLHAQLKFFEENTSGRIINRFSKDISTLDNLVFTVLEMIDYMVKCFFSLALVVWIVPWLLLVVGLSLIYLLRLRKKSIFVSRDCMRLKSTLTSPVNSLI